MPYKQGWETLVTISFHFRWLASFGIIGGYFRNRCFGNGGSESENDRFVRIVVTFLSGQYGYCISSAI